MNKYLIQQEIQETEKSISLMLERLFSVLVCISSIEIGENDKNILLILSVEIAYNLKMEFQNLILLKSL